MHTRIDLAALTLVLWTAFDALDDIADGDVDTRWPGFDSNELGVMASALIATTAHVIAHSLHDSPDVQARLHLRIARGLGEMADGQIEDLDNARSADVTSDRVFSSVAGKTGGECALFAGLGAVLAGVSPERQRCYERLGFEYGMANQFVSDLAELSADPDYRDIRNGSRTLPLVWHLEMLERPARDAFVALMESARRDAAAAERVRETLLASPAYRRAVLQVILHLGRARAALAESASLGPAAAGLAAFLDDVHPFGER